VKSESLIRNSGFGCIAGAQALSFRLAASPFAVVSLSVSLVLLSKILTFYHLLSQAGDVPGAEGFGARGG
jgi:hypothetical protein